VKRLTLMRHANAQWKDAQLADADRPLNRRGQSEAEAMGRRLIELQLLPAALLSSPARRAQQTADIVSRELRVGARNLRTEESLYLAPAQEILRLVRATGPRIPHLLVVGHNPGITEAAQLLAPAQVPGLATAAVCSLRFDTQSWSDVGPENLQDVLNEAPTLGMFALWA